MLENIGEQNLNSLAICLQSHAKKIMAQNRHNVTVSVFYTFYEFYSSFGRRETGYFLKAREVELA